MPTLLGDKSNELGGLHPNTIAAIQHLQRRWRARGKDKTKPSLAEGEQDQEDGAQPPVRERCSVVTPAQTGITRTSPRKLRSRGSDRAHVGTDNRSPTINDDHDENGANIVLSQSRKRCRTRIHQPRDLSETRFGEEGDEVIQDSDRSSDRDARGDKHFAPSHDGRAGDDEEDNVRPPASKRRKSNRHLSEVEPKLGWSLRRRLASRRDDSARAEDEEGDGTCQPPSKRRKASSLARSTVLRSATRRHLHSDAASRSQRVRTSASGRKRSDRHSVLSLPPSQKSIDRKAVFEEWPLGNAVLKRVTVGRMTTFQVQFTWDSCATHGRKDHATEDPQDTYPVGKSSSLRRGGAAGLHLTPDLQHTSGRSRGW